MPALTAHTALIGSTTSTSSATYVDVTASISGAMKASTKYLVMCTAHVTCDNANSPWSMRLIERSSDPGAVEIDTSVVTRETATTGRENPYMWTGIYTTTSNVPDNGGIVLQQKVSNVAHTVSTEYASLVVLELTNLNEGADYFVTTDNNEATETVDLVERVSYELDPATAGPWLVFAFMSTDVDIPHNDSTNIVFTQTTTTDGTPTATVASELQFEGEDTTEIIPNVQSWVQDYTGVDSVEWKIETKGVGGVGFNKYLASSLVGLRLNALENYSINATVVAKAISSSFTNRFDPNIITPTTDGTVVFVGTQSGYTDSTGRSWFTKFWYDSGGGYATWPNAAQSSSDSFRTYDPSDVLTTLFVATLPVVADTDYDYKLQCTEGSNDPEAESRAAAFVAFTLEIVVPVRYSSEAGEVFSAGQQESETYSAGQQASEITG
jgi:hypothetical protein